ncbi:GlsB/YeaQ/YmgE family stress response membrane protein [Paludibacter sp. 221]|uniref:GlsB/YeaQ/YmgE family stress response membrane protein n=1 Tax=Paludibacter sp. 221 TaxID=2302939 RepID=UPI0013CFD3B9|nr:GlsB/YeaQ/YmgE family stress response membrane protein [Paludibacter sp. 221]NDV46064.1 GlsB/YeaQ/YmgE family stress response membrane protein [Paludibacter sp. 221]
MSWLWFILIGLLSGWLAGIIVKGGGSGIIMNLVIGIIGSLLGGFLFSLLGITTTSILGSILMSVAGAVVLLLLVNLIMKAVKK